MKNYPEGMVGDISENEYMVVNESDAMGLPQEANSMTKVIYISDPSTYLASKI